MLTWNSHVEHSVVRVELPRGGTGTLQFRRYHLIPLEKNSASSTYFIGCQGDW